VAARLGYACVGTCQKVFASIRSARNKILTESLALLSVPERMVSLALNEAEGLAWQTPYPHLLFPELAAEKVQAVARWSSRQRAVSGRGGGWRVEGHLSHS